MWRQPHGVSTKRFQIVLSQRFATGPRNVGAGAFKSREIGCGRNLGGQFGDQKTETRAEKLPPIKWQSA
jgi:hypothetical protein